MITSKHAARTETKVQQAHRTEKVIYRQIEADHIWLASLAEWSMAVDLSSTIERCVSSNLTARRQLFFAFWEIHIGKSNRLDSMFSQEGVHEAESGGRMNV